MSNEATSDRLLEVQNERDEWIRIALNLQNQKAALETRLQIAEEMISAVHRICLEMGIEPMEFQGEAS